MPNDFQLSHMPLSSIITNSNAGKRFHPLKRVVRDHGGIDLKTKLPDTLDGKRDVLAAHDGVVIRIGWTNNGNQQKTNLGFGKIVIVMHEQTKILTLYAHLDKDSNYVSQNQIVRAGNKIADSGNTGASSGAHLHFEVIDGNLETGYGRVWQVIKNSPDGISTFGKKGGGNLHISDSFGRLSPRKYLTDLALRQSKQQLGLEAIPDHLLTNQQKKDIETESCQIFSCEINSGQAQIGVTSDERSNQFTETTLAKHHNFLSEYNFPDISRIAFDTITDAQNDGRLFLNGKEVKNNKPACITSRIGRDEDALVENRWIMRHDGKNYYLVKDGDDLLIMPQLPSILDYDLIPESAKDYIRIVAFNFEDGAFGIKLVDITAQEVVVTPEYVSFDREIDGLTVLLSNKRTAQVVSHDTVNEEDPEGEGRIQSGSITVNIRDEDGLNPNDVVVEYQGVMSPNPRMEPINNSDIFLYGQSVNSGYIGFIVDSQSFDISEQLDLSLVAGSIHHVKQKPNGEIIIAGKGFDADLQQSFAFIQSLGVDGNNVHEAEIYPNADIIGSLAYDFEGRSFLLYTTTDHESEIVSVYVNNNLIQEIPFDLSYLSQGFSICPLENGGFAMLYPQDYVRNDQTFIGSYLHIFDSNFSKITDTRISSNSGIFAKCEYLKNDAFIVFHGSNSYGQYVRIYDQNGYRIRRYTLNYPGDQVVKIDNGVFATSDGLTRSDTNIIVRVIDASRVTGGEVCPNQFQMPWQETIEELGISQQSYNLDQDVTYAANSLIPTVFAIPEIVSSPSGKENIFEIANFRSGSLSDQIDLGSINNYILLNKKFFKEQYNNKIQIILSQQAQDTVITILNNNIDNTKIILQDFDYHDFLLEFLTGIDPEIEVSLESLEFVGIDQQVTYSQLDATVTLPNLAINATNPDAIIDFELTLISQNGDIIDNPDELLVQVGETDLGTISTFNNGTFAINNATVSEANDLLEDLTIDLGVEFDQEFTISANLRYQDPQSQTQLQIIEDSLEVNYQCQSLEPEIQELINSQQTQAGQEVVLNMVRYFYDPNLDLNITIGQLVYNISLIAQNHTNPHNETCLDIQALNQTAFKIFTNCTGHYDLRALAQDQCLQETAQEFGLTVEEFVALSQSITNSQTNSQSPSQSLTATQTNSYSNTQSWTQSQLVSILSNTATGSLSPMASNPRTSTKTPTPTNSYLPSQPNQQQESQEQEESNNPIAKIIPIAAPITGGILLLTFGLCYMAKRYKANQEQNDVNNDGAIEMQTAPGSHVTNAQSQQTGNKKENCVMM